MWRPWLFWTDWLTDWVNEVVRVDPWVQRTQFLGAIWLDGRNKRGNRYPFWTDTVGSNGEGGWGVSFLRGAKKLKSLLFFLHRTFAFVSRLTPSQSSPSLFLASLQKYTNKEKINVSILLQPIGAGHTTNTSTKKWRSLFLAKVTPIFCIKKKEFGTCRVHCERNKRLYIVGRKRETRSLKKGPEENKQQWLF